MYVHHEERGRSTGKQEEVFEINGNLYKKTENIIWVESKWFIAIRETRFCCGLPTGLAELGGA